MVGRLNRRRGLRGMVLNVVCLMVAVRAETGLRTMSVSTTETRSSQHIYPIALSSPHWESTYPATCREGRLLLPASPRHSMPFPHRVWSECLSATGYDCHPSYSTGDVATRYFKYHSSGILHRQQRGGMHIELPLPDESAPQVRTYLSQYDRVVS